MRKQKAKSTPAPCPVTSSSLLPPTRFVPRVTSSCSDPALPSLPSLFSASSPPDRMWSTGEGNGKPLQYSCLESPMNSMRWQNDRILKEELPWSVGAQYVTGDKWRNNSRKNEGMEPKQKQQLWMWLVIEARSNAIKSNIA